MGGAISTVPRWGTTTKNSWERVTGGLELFARYAFEVALLPCDWPLASVLERDLDWDLPYPDGVALVLVRRPGTVPGSG